MKENVYCSHYDKKFLPLFQFFYKSYNLFIDDNVSCLFDDSIVPIRLVCLSKALCILKNRDINLYELFREMTGLDIFIKDEEYKEYFYFLLEFRIYEYKDEDELDIIFSRVLLYVVDIYKKWNNMKTYYLDRCITFDELIDKNNDKKTIEIWKNELITNKSLF